MRSSWRPLLLVGLMGGASVLGGDHFRIKARLLPGAPAGANYRHSDVVSRGIYTAMLDSEEVVADLNYFRKIQKPAVGESVAEVAVESAKSKTSRKIFRSAVRDVATTVEVRSVAAAPVRLDDIRLAAYSDGHVSFTGRLQDLPKAGSSDATVKERTDGCRVTIRVRGYGSTEVAATAVTPNGPLLFECVQNFWMSKRDDCAISLICPEDLRICGSHYQELTHLQVEVETRRNR